MDRKQDEFHFHINVRFANKITTIAADSLQVLNLKCNWSIPRRKNNKKLSKYAYKMVCNSSLTHYETLRQYHQYVYRVRLLTKLNDV